MSEEIKVTKIQMQIVLATLAFDVGPNTREVIKEIIRIVGAHQEPVKRGDLYFKFGLYGIPPEQIRNTEKVIRSLGVPVVD